MVGEVVLDIHFFLSHNAANQAQLDGHGVDRIPAIPAVTGCAAPGNDKLTWTEGRQALGISWSDRLGQAPIKLWAIFSICSITVGKNSKKQTN